MSKNGLSLILVLLVGALLCFAFAACDQRPVETEFPSIETDLTYQSIDQRGFAGTPKLYEEKEPGLVVIARPEEVNKLEGILRDEARSALLALDYGEYFALVAFQGRKTSGGYSITIDRVSRAGNTVNIYVQLNEPKPEMARADAITSPYHLVVVTKEGIWDNDILFTLIAEERVVASASYYIP